VKLNLGSGIKRFEGFLNVDSDPLCNPDYVLVLGKETLPFDDNSVEEILLHHVFEHIGEGFFDMLKELYRICKHGAIIDVQVPHPRHDYFLGDLTHVRQITIENMRPLSKAWCTEQSYITSSWSGLAHQLDVDFDLFEYNYILDETFIQIIQQIDNEEQINWMARSMNNAISEIHFKLRVIKE
jgi:ubiquinone/menaquinone biosynthesis C-methylase UbiE